LELEKEENNIELKGGKRASGRPEGGWRVKIA
jgi:hypothetical protein